MAHSPTQINDNIPYSVWNAGITGVSGTLAKGQVLTINGLDFGNAPAFSECFYDSCDKTGARSATDPEIGGSWDVLGSQAYVSNGARDGGSSARVLFYDPVDDASSQQTSGKRFTESSNVYFSYWYRHMPNTFWPDGVGATEQVTGRDTFDGAGSSAKLVWLQHDDRPDFIGTGTNDIVLPTYNSSSFGVLGNDVPEFIALGTDWWTFGDWIKISGYFTVDPTDRAKPTKQIVEIYNPSHPTQKYYKFEVDTAVLENSDPTAPLNWQYIAFGAWYRNGAFAALGATDESDVNHQIDDIYLSWGNNSAARVMLGDAAAIEDCTELTECYPSGENWWTDEQISVVVEQGGLNLSGDVWVHVRHSDNRRNMSYKVN